jgi:hypothetical protein
MLWEGAEVDLCEVRQGAVACSYEHFEECAE